MSSVGHAVIDEIVFSCMKGSVGFIFITKYRDIFFSDYSRQFSVGPFHVTAGSVGLAAIPICPWVGVQALFSSVTLKIRFLLTIFIECAGNICLLLTRTCYILTDTLSRCSFTSVNYASRQKNTGGSCQIKQ